MARSRKARLSLWMLTLVCRLALAATFIFSGTVKLIDPQGVAYKLEDYAQAFGLFDYLHGVWALTAGIALAVVEFMLGIYMLFGIRRRRTLQAVVLFLLVMTPLTLYLAIANPISDCGCFGDALKLTNWQTFGKNAILLPMAIFALVNRRRFSRLVSERNQWLVSLYSWAFSIVFALYNLYALPLVDFRPYHVGANLLQGVMDERYGSDLSMRYIDLSMLSAEGEDLTEEWLAQPGFKYLLVAPYLPLADDANTDRINNIYEYCLAHGYPFLCLTSSGPEEMEQWQDNTGAEYPFALTDGTVLKTMIRSNPGLIRLHDGVIVEKYAHTQLPDILPSDPALSKGEEQERSYLRDALRILLFFVVPLFLFVLADHIWMGSIFYRRYKIRLKIKNNILSNNKS